MNVDYWAVGSNSSTTLSFTPTAISSHLIADWIPSLSPDVSNSIIGWPHAVLSSVTIGDTPYLTLNENLGQCERQWKGFLSWMIGVAGARHVLQSLNYRWIAPCSAFYPNNRIEVGIRWHQSFPRGKLLIEPATPTTSKLRPDYIALKASSAGCPTEFCIAEAKGCDQNLKSKHACPAAWKSQVDNVQLLLSGTQVSIPRKIVIATRVSPNLVNAENRRIQVRAWNSQGSAPGISITSSVPIVVAHLVGLYRNLEYPDLRMIRWLLRFAPRWNAEPSQSESALAPSGSLEMRDLRKLADRLRKLADRLVPNLIRQRYSGRNLEIEICEATRVLTASLILARNNYEAASAILRADDELNQWYDRTDWEGWFALPCGVKIREL